MRKDHAAHWVLMTPLSLDARDTQATLPAGQGVRGCRTGECTTAEPWLQWALKAINTFQQALGDLGSWQSRAVGFPSLAQNHSAAGSCAAALLRKGTGAPVTTR